MQVVRARLENVRAQFLLVDGDGGGGDDDDDGGGGGDDDDDDDDDDDIATALARLKALVAHRMRRELSICALARSRPCAMRTSPTAFGVDAVRDR